MPIPVIAIAIVAPATAAAVIVAYTITKQRLAKKIAKKRVAILGRRQTGKTALLEFLQTPSIDNALSSAEMKTGGGFSMDVGGKPVSFDVPRDLPGNEGLGLQNWKGAFAKADIVWYLFRADLVAEQDADELALLKQHLSMFATWDNPGHPKVITLIGTWADNSSEWQRSRGAFEHAVADADPIKVGLVELRDARLIVGSLHTKKDARYLVRSLQRRHG